MLGKRVGSRLRNKARPGTPRELFPSTYSLMISYSYSFVGLTRYLAKVIEGHTPVDLFDNPRRADLTGNIDFAYLAEALAGTGASRSPTQPRSTD